MQAPVVNLSGQQVSTIDLPADIFEVEINTGLMHQAYVRQMAHARLGTASTQRRGEVNRTSAKWYRQKGTGRARHGSRDATQFVGGGRPKGPKPHKYIKDMPRKMRQQAIRCALSALARDNQLVFVDRVTLDAPKTKAMRAALDAVAGKDASALVLLADHNDNVERSIRNLDDVRYLRVNYLNMRDLLRFDKVIVPLDALDVIKALWGRKEEE
ncbi:MAG: 50S ribosomal protein L4 [Chloroflexi bacterium]|nr:50S ribosomal protein L4 [Chloroflexota bacterium]